MDLNLLVIFDALMAERNVTRAAQRIGLSQPAFSNALSRLRHYLQDELFIRGPDGMRPTPRALELASEIHEALNSIESALDPVNFEPGSARRTFTIDTNDYIVTTCIPALMRRLALAAPGIDVRIVPPAGRAFERLDAREIEFGIGVYGDVPARFGVDVVVESDTFVCMMRPDHPLARGRFDLKRYAGAKHLLITPRGDPRGFIDDALAEHGLTRRIVLTVNQFSVAPTIIACSDLIVTLPKRIADLYAPLFDLKLRPAPLPAPASFRSIEIIWHRRLGAHPAHAWFREQLKQVILESARNPLPNQQPCFPCGPEASRAAMVAGK